MIQRSTVFLPDGHQLVGKHIHLYMVRAVDLTLPRSKPHNMTRDLMRSHEVETHVTSRAFLSIKHPATSKMVMACSIVEFPFGESMVSHRLESLARKSQLQPLELSPSSWNSTPRTGGKDEGSNERGIDQVDLAKGGALHGPMSGSEMGS